MKEYTVKPVDHKKKYRSYLLRLWFEDTNGRGVWRISLENPFSGERRGFASLKDLCRFLEEKMHASGKNQEVSDE
jgi:hypothetical protein